VTPEEDAAEALSSLETCDVRQLRVMCSGSSPRLLPRCDVVKWLQLRLQHGLGWRPVVFWPCITLARCG
jgi:hypothetical protein